MYLLKNAQSAFIGVPQCYTSTLITDDHRSTNQIIKDLVRFYLRTSGNERLLGRIDDLGRNLALNLVRALYIKSGQSIVACAILYHHPDLDIDEIGSVLIHPDHTRQGLYKILREQLVNHTNAKAVVMFERLEPAKRPHILQGRALEGWRELSHNDPIFRRIETSKPSLPSTFPPKTGLIYKHQA